MISVVIPAYKKTEQLVANLQNNMPFLKGTEVIIVNDDPSASIKTQMSDFPTVKLIENTKNLGFAGAVNVGMKEATGLYIMLLNSDVRLRDNSFEKAVSYFESNPKLFGVGFAQIERNGEIIGKNKMFWHQGMLLHSKADNLLAGNTAWAEGGSSLFDAAKLKELNYFDELFSPFYWEDIDLSYRAWKRGYEVLFMPEVQVEHSHESTIGAFYQAEKIKRIAYRNQLLFIWKNITEFNLIFSHILLLEFNILRMLIKRELQFIIAFVQALPLIGVASHRAAKEARESKLSDSEVLAKFK